MHIPRGQTRFVSLADAAHGIADGDLLLYNKNDRRQLIDRIAFRPNRVVAADGSIPHAARAPSDNRFRMSVIVRGVYTVSTIQSRRMNRSVPKGA